MAEPISLPSQLWTKLSRAANKTNTSPEALAVQLVRDGLGRMAETSGEYLPWSACPDIGEKHGRSWRDGNSAYNWAYRWNVEHPEGDPLHITMRWGQVHRDQLIQALQVLRTRKTVHVKPTDSGRWRVESEAVRQAGPANVKARKKK